MRPQHGVTHCRIDLIHDADEPLRLDHRAQSARADARAGAEVDRGLVADAAAVQAFGGNKAPAKTRAEPNQLSESVVLALEGAGLHRAERKAVEMRLFGVRLEQ